MAPPYVWFDEIVTTGWLAVLSGSALRLLWAVGKFYYLTATQAKADSITLQTLAGFGRTTYYDALAELTAHKLIEVTRGTLQAKYREYPTCVYRFTQPVPPVPPECVLLGAGSKASAGADTIARPARPRLRKKSSARADKTVRPDGQRNGRNPRQEKVPTPEAPTDSTQLGGLGVQEAERVAQICLPGASAEMIRLVIEWAAAAARAPSLKAQRVREAADALSSRSNLPAPVVQDAVEQVAAVLHPVVLRAVQLFNARVIETTRVDA